MVSFKSHRDSDSSFLPEDYLAGKAERRTNVLAVTLFAIVTLGVVGAFFVTNREWNDVRQYQEAINVRYSQAALDIEQLKELERQKGELVKKAELTTALIERVPRSILIAELVNRMPEDVTLLELEIEAERVKTLPSRSPAKKRRAASLASRSADNEKAPEEDEPEAPRYDTSIAIVGVAPEHAVVALYGAQLQDFDLLRNVDLKFSDKTIIQDREMFKFRIEAELKPDADARDIEPIRSPRAPGSGDTPPGNASPGDVIGDTLKGLFGG